MNCNNNCKGFQKPSKELEDKLRQIIKSALEKVTENNSPYVYKHIQTKQDYLLMENSILEQMLQTTNLPEEIIPQIELQYTEE